MEVINCTSVWVGLGHKFSDWLLFSAINKCDPNPCKNGATCQQTAGDNYICICPPSFKGTLCTGKAYNSKVHYSKQKFEIFCI